MQLLPGISISFFTSDENASSLHTLHQIPPVFTSCVCGLFKRYPCSWRQNGINTNGGQSGVYCSNTSAQERSMYNRLLFRQNKPLCIFLATTSLDKRQKGKQTVTLCNSSMKMGLFLDPIGVSLGS